MREIKFRAWDKKNKIMHKEVGVHVEGWAMVFHTYKDFTPHKDIELMQFTGLKDKNGVEIYEGDVVGWNFKGEFETYEVRYYPGTFCFEMGEGAYAIAEYEEMGLEVIGNIYKNPELLEKGMK